MDSYNSQEAQNMLTKWEKVVSDAKYQLQTTLRAQERYIRLPSSVGFKQSNVSANGQNQNVNT